uniref:Uncharacterized protein n=1 Tax=Rhizophora mucronata TaxID=61149 RepID=A0A2P2QCT6_RHIMU
MTCKLLVKENLGQHMAPTSQLHFISFSALSWQPNNNYNLELT